MSDRKEMLIPEQGPIAGSCHGVLLPALTEVLGDILDLIGTIAAVVMAGLLLAILAEFWR